MQGSTIKAAVMAILIASALPLLACGDSGTPTSATQAGPPVSDGTPTTIRGVITQMSRSGDRGISVVFRINLEPIRGDAGTEVIDGSAKGDTTYLRDGQTVTIDARLRADYVYAKQVIIDRKP